MATRSKQVKYERESNSSGAWLVLAILFALFAIGALGGAFIEYMAASQLSQLGATGFGGMFEGATIMYLLVGMLFLVITGLSIHYYRTGR